MSDRRIALAILTICTLAMAIATTPAYGQFNVLYNFGTNNGDPFQPGYTGTIAQGRDGNLYTTITSGGGGAGNCGSVVKVTPAGTLTVIYSFDGTLGCNPQSGLTLGTDGNFYGTTYSGGTGCCGTIFKITPGGTPTVLYNFTGGNDGGYPYSPPIQGTDGNWYGTTYSGGVNGFGTIYKLPAGGGVPTTLFSFDNTHGNGPRDPLVQGTDGNLYGTALYGGTIGYGVIFKEKTSGGTPTVLFNFDNTHGGYPVSPLIQGLDGNLYGTAEDYGSLGGGVAFKITPSGTLTVLHNMNASTDGEVPYAGLLQASDGNLYGVNGAVIGGGNSGTIFKMTTSGTFSTVHVFSGADGAAPQVTPFQHTNGTFYGDTWQGGSGSIGCAAGACGVFYSLNAGLPAFINLLPYSGKVGSKIGILGQGFSNTSVVKFNGVQATTIALTGTTFILATVPAGASDGYVTVTTGATTLKSLRKFTVHNSWGQGKAIPTPVAFASAAVVGSQIYVLGGYSGSTYSNPVANNQVYNPSTNAWSTGTAMPSGLAQSAAAVVNNIVYVMGGTPDGSTDSNAVWAYNPATKIWSVKASMPTARRSLAATVESGIIYAIGGFSSGGGRLKTVEAYNPATDSWTTKASMLEGKSEPTVGLIGSTIVSADGFNGTAEDGDNEGYNAGTNTWSALKADPTARDGACGGAIGSQLYVAGGFTSVAVSTVNDAFNPSTNLWTTLAPISQSTALVASAVYKSQLYCFGGWGTGNGGALPIGNVQAYQP